MLAMQITSRLVASTRRCFVRASHSRALETHTHTLDIHYSNELMELEQKTKRAHVNVERYFVWCAGEYICTITALAKSVTQNPSCIRIICACVKYIVSSIFELSWESIMNEYFKNIQNLKVVVWIYLHARKQGAEKTVLLSWNPLNK